VMTTTLFSIPNEFCILVSLLLGCISHYEDSGPAYL
jgi:hypothetical protein